MISDQLRYKINHKIPTDGEYWHSDTAEDLVKVAEKLSVYKLPEELIYDVIETCFNAGKSEYE